MALALAALLAPGSAHAAASTSRVSLSSAEAQGNGASTSPAVSRDGRYVAFASRASNLVAGDTNGKADIFLRDREFGGNTGRASVSASGAQANGDSGQPALSPDGRFVAFVSTASNLVAGDTNGKADVFVRDRRTGAVTRESVSTAETQANADSTGPSISGDGRYVVFASAASNLVSGDTNVCTAGEPSHPCSDVFIRDRLTGYTARISVSSGGTQGNGDSGNPAITPDGRYVAFDSRAALVTSDTAMCVDEYRGGPAYNCRDVYVRDRQTGAVSRASLSNTGAQANEESGGPSITPDGRYVAFGSNATNLTGTDGNQHSCFDTENCTDVYVRDRLSARTEIVSVDSAERQASGYSGGASISADGRYVAFVYQHWGSALVPEYRDALYTDVLLRDRVGGTTTRASRSTGGTQANASSEGPDISADGLLIAFGSEASNLLSGDTNGRSDIFLRSR